MRYRSVLPLLALLGLLFAACSGQSNTTSPRSTSTGTQPAAGAAFASYVGKWEVHGSLLTITAQHTGMEQWNVGPCLPSSTDSPMCNGNANITFTLNHDGSITGTIRSVQYTQWDGKPAPVGFQPDPTDLHAGDTFQLRHVKPHLLYTTWFGPRQSTLNSGNRYWCDTYTSTQDRQLCGA